MKQRLHSSNECQFNAHTIFFTLILYSLIAGVFVLSFVLTIIISEKTDGGN